MPAKSRAFSVEDLWALKRIGAASLSPDGRHVCVAVTGYDMKENESTSSLWLLSTDGRTQRQLTSGKKDHDPQWSPDGKLIAFIAKRDENKEQEGGELFVIAPDGGEARRVAKIATGLSGLRWFPDSRQLAYISWVWPELSDPKEQAKRAKQEKDDKVRAYVVDKNNYRFWDHWFPRGRVPHLHAIDIKTGKSRDLFAGTPYHLSQQSAEASEYDISPDGQEIAFTYITDPDPKAPVHLDIVALDLAKRRFRNLTEKSERKQGRASSTPRYAPDGSQIAFLSQNYQKLYNEQSRAGVIDRAKGTVRVLSEAWDRGIEEPLAWAADSKSVYFTAEDGIARPVFRLDIAGKGVPVEILRGPSHGGTAGDLRLSRDGALMVFSRSSLTHPPQLFAAKSDRSKPRKIERFNDQLLGQFAFDAGESVTVKGFDGDAVQMSIVKPPGFDAKKKYPLMHVIHGGPHTCFGDAWHWRWNAQIYAGWGYVLAMVNYHGSSGFGQGFLASINADWGRREMADIEAGTDYMLKSGYIDKAQMVATGGSYGGYMVAYMNGRLAKSRYQAYVCHAGCFDWVSMMGGDVYFYFPMELGSFPWENEAHFLSQSPHTEAGKFKTPTLVIHGELDYRVPYYQGLAYYNTLRARDVPSRLVFFPDENHWILKPQNSRLWYREFREWCDHYTGRATRKTPALAAAG